MADKLPFKMLTQKRILGCIQSQGWFAAVDLKDAFKSRFFLDTGRSYGLRSRVGHGSTRSSPSGCPCSPHVFMKIMEGALALLWEVGIRNLNYRNDWLIMAQSRDQLCDHRDLVLWHLSQLGLRGQLGKEQALTCVENLFPHYGVRLGEYDDVSHQRVLNCLSSLRGRTVVPLKDFQSLLGHMASTATVMQLGLLHMIPLQHWLHSRVPRWAWRCGTHCVTITPMCCYSFSPWLDLAFLRAGVPLQQVSQHVIVRTNTSSFSRFQDFYLSHTQLYRV